jgi:uncharacterized membrane protein
MSVCPSCGGLLDDGVCRRCATSAPPVAPAIEDNIASALCYLLLGVTGVLFLWLEPYSRNRKVRFHAFQAIFVNVAIIVFWVSISLLGGKLALLISPMFLLVCLILWLALIWTAWQNQRIMLPLIGPMAEKQA